MNRQAITFLSLFTLILVLSVYYIMLPAEDNTTITKELTTIEELQSALNQKRDEIISKNNEIIAQESSTSEIINKALETISQTKDIRDKEKDLLELIQKLGYQDIYVEIDEKIVKVTIIKKDATQSDANNIIKTVLTHLGQEYQVEVKFINE